MSKLCQKCSQVWAAPNNLYCTPCHLNKRIAELEAEKALAWPLMETGLLAANGHIAELEAERDAHWPQVLIKCADLEAENKEQTATIAAIEKWVIRNKCFVSVEAFRENMQHRAALTKEDDDEPDEDYPPCPYCGEPQCDCDTL